MELLILTAVIITAIRLIVDYRQIEIKKKAIDKRGYRLRNIATGGAIFLTSLLLSLHNDYNLFQAIAVIWSIFWLFFSYSLNIARKKPFFYTGGKDHPSKSKPIYDRLGPIGLLFTKLWFFGVAIKLFYSWHML